MFTGINAGTHPWQYLVCRGRNISPKFVTVVVIIVRLTKLMRTSTVLPRVNMTHEIQTCRLTSGLQGAAR